MTEIIRGEPILPVAAPYDAARMAPPIAVIVNAGGSEPINNGRQAMRYDANKKSAGTAYVLWFFLSVTGAHRFYLRRTFSAVIMLLLSCTVVGLFITIPWTVLDAFLIPGMARRYNDDLINLLT